jgi:hypothetical protein
MVIDIVTRYLRQITLLQEGHVPPAGYNPLDKIRDGLFHWVPVPFNGVKVLCELRCPNETQISSCGNWQTIYENIKLPNQKIEDLQASMIDYYEYYEKLCKIVFHTPTFDNLVAKICDLDFVISEKQRELENIRKKIELNKMNMPEHVLRELNAKYNEIALAIGFILPHDAMAFISQWVHARDLTDMKYLNNEMLLNAAFKARAYNKPPHEFIEGVFTSHNATEIDSYALTLLEKHLEEDSKAKEGLTKSQVSKVITTTKKGKPIPQQSHKGA